MQSDTKLPVDIFLLICEELGAQRDFKTLYNCARAGKYLVRPALRSLYQIPNIALGTNESTEIDISRINQVKESSAATIEKNYLRYVRHWAMQWKSIILSALDKTAFPYCLYIQSLDLSDLESLLEDPLFRSNVQKDFFTGDLKSFYSELSVNGRAGRGRYNRLDISEVKSRVGDAITKYTGSSTDHNGPVASLEDLNEGRTKVSNLQTWIGRIARLKSITIWDGSILDDGVAEAISLHCPGFESLTIYNCVNLPDRTVDFSMGAFLGGLTSNTLSSFSIIGSNEIGRQTFEALSQHQSESLKELKLGSLRTHALTAIDALQGCTALETLDLESDDGAIDLENTQNDVYLGVVAWLKSCKRLKNIRLKNFLSGPAILTALCLDDTISLKSLGLVTYTLVGNRSFHTALSNQTSLERLELRGDAEDSEYDDNQGLIAAISQLTQLRSLNLLEITEYFNTQHIASLAQSLPLLEELYVAGYDVRDEVWPSLSGLHYLRTLSFQAMTHFSFEAIMDYIFNLQPTNTGLLLSVMSAAQDSILSEAEQAMIKKAIQEKVDGSFEFVLYREQESDFDSESD